MHQEREYPGRVVGTHLRNPDFAAYARAFGGHGETVEDARSSSPPSSARWRAERAGDPARQARPRGDHADDDADRDPRSRARRSAADPVPDTSLGWALLLAGASLAGLVQGMTGFAFAIVA